MDRRRLLFAFAMKPPANPLLLMECSLDALRSKLGDLRSPLASWWQHVLTMAREDPVWFSPYTVLAALVTDDACYRDLARQQFLRIVETAAEGETSLEAQYHTHVTAAPLGRWAIFYDWVADMQLFSPAEDAAIRASMLDFAFTFPLQQLQSRIRAFDNQIMANAFGVAAVGYVFGVKRGDNPLARRLFDTGLGRLKDLLGRLPAGGYSPEGSAYHEQVVLPLTLLSSLLVEETTGMPVIDGGVPPACRPVRELLHTSFRMIGPGGLLPAWDAYGFQSATVKSGLAYLAKISGDPQPLAVIRASDMWYRNAHPAWEMDDRLWTLVWWPTETDKAVEPLFPSWMVPEVGGALQESGRGIRLFQCWDECGGVPSSGRSQVDPNAITLEAFHSPILLDGSGRPGQDVLSLPTGKVTEYVGRRTIETVKEYLSSTWGAMPTSEEAVAVAMDGSVGMANSLILDDEGWFVPLGPRSGHGEALHKVGPLQVLRSDATAYYADRYDVSRMTRTSALVRGQYLLISDRVTAATPHAVTWQAYARQQAKLVDETVVIRTPELVRCDLIPLQSGSLKLTPVEGYPTIPESYSIRVQHTLPGAADVRLDIGLVPQSCLSLLADLTDGWERDICGRKDSVSLATAYLTDPATDMDTPRIYQRQVTLSLDPNQRYFLVVGIASRLLQVMVNAQPVTATTEQAKGIWSDSSGFLPWVFEVTNTLRDGINDISLTAPFFHGESLAGPVTLCVEQEPRSVSVVRAGHDAFIVTSGEDTDQVLIERNGGVAPWAGGETDARYAFYAADGTVAAACVTYLTLPGGPTVHSHSPCDLVWTPQETALVQWVDGTTVEVAWEQGHLWIEMGACIGVTFRGQAPHRLKLDLPLARLVVVNGGAIGTCGGPEAASVILELLSSPVECRTPTTVEEAYALAERCGDAASEGLLDALRGEDWRVQVAAADMAGRLGIRKAVPVLLELFARAEAELPYPALTKWWRWSKMLHEPGEVGPDTALPRPIGVKRWRVKRAVVTALGKLGDQQAVAPFEAALNRCNDFFPVTSQLAVALGRLGSPTSIPVLDRHAHHAEANTRVHARLALSLLKGKIDRASFEAQVGLG